MKINRVKAKSIIVKTNLPEGDFVINPYTGCSHGCKYCYARFMKRFTNHNEPWGEFVDVKINAPNLIPEKTDKYKNRSITIGSVTDPYQPAEKEFQITRKILKKLIPLKPKFVDILTKSDLIVRDIDLIKQFDNCLVAISLSMFDESLRRQLEPSAPAIKKRLVALKTLHQNNIPTALFISPIFPEITNWEIMIKETKSFVGEYWFENLNLYPSIKGNIYQFLKANRPKLVAKYREIYSAKSKYWNQVEEEINNFCTQNKISYKIYFHH